MRQTRNEATIITAMMTLWQPLQEVGTIDSGLMAGLHYGENNLVEYCAFCHGCHYVMTQSNYNNVLNYCLF